MRRQTHIRIYSYCCPVSREKRTVAQSPEMRVRAPINIRARCSLILLNNKRHPGCTRSLLFFFLFFSTIDIRYERAHNLLDREAKKTILKALFLLMAGRVYSINAHAVTETWILWPQLYISCESQPMQSSSIKQREPRKQQRNN